MIPVGILASAHVNSAASYMAEVLADSPNLYWRFTEASGTCNDYSGNARHGTYESGSSPATSLLTGDADPARSIPATGAVVRAWESWQDDTTFTIEAIIKPNTVAGSAYLSIAQTEGSDRYWVFNCRGEDLGLFYGPSSGNVIQTSSSPIVAGSSYHVAAVCGASSMILYVNGVSLTTVASPLSGPTGSTRIFMVGAQTLGGGNANRLRYYNGIVDEVAHYPTALSGARILAHAQAAGF